MSKIEPTCGKCLLFNPKKRECGVVILHAGKKFHLPVEFTDTCFFEDKFQANGEEFTPAEDIKQVKFWVEDPNTGEKTKGNGVIKVEYPEGFFGET